MVRYLIEPRNCLVFTVLFFFFLGNTMSVIMSQRNCIISAHKVLHRHAETLHCQYVEKPPIPLIPRVPLIPPDNNRMIPLIRLQRQLLYTSTSANNPL